MLEQKQCLLGLITTELEAIADSSLSTGTQPWKDKNTALKIYRLIPSTFIA